MPNDFNVPRAAGLALALVLSSVFVQADDGKENTSLISSGESARTDGVMEKIRLLEKAWRSGRRDVAMSLSESLKDTLAYEEENRRTPGSFHVGPGDVKSVTGLRRQWATWAEGWAHYQVVSLVETEGIARDDEPVHLRMGAAAGQMRDPWREIRIARVHHTKQILEEVPSQILDHVRMNGEHRCEVVFQAQVGGKGRAHYLILFGNPNAELPGYTSDLKTRCQGNALDIENRHYRARLSPQMGQLDQLISKREHGLELFAGGKGHGEPPTIDWAHDYVDAGNFQKLRMRNWASCPN